MERYVAGPAYGQKYYKMPINQGGTFSKTPSEARVNLEALGIDDRNKPLGPLGLDQRGKASITEFDDNVPLGRNTVTGLTEIYVNQVHSYTITDYDSLTNYTVEAIGTGLVSILYDTIIYTPGTDPGVKGFKLNGRKYSVLVKLPTVDKPELTRPIDNSLNINRTLDVISSEFQVLGGFDTHQCSDWQVATDPSFTNIVAESLIDTVNKISWQPVGMLKNTDHYLRVRYRGNSIGYGPWSDPVKFKTKIELVPSVEERLSYPTDRTANARYGISIDISKDGNRIVIGASGINAVYVLRRDPTGWIQEQKISGPASSLFGASVGISGDGSRIIIGAPNQAGSSSQAGRVHFWHRSDNLWSSKVILVASNQTSNAHNGASVAMNDEGTWAISGTPDRSSNRGGAVVFLFSTATDTWVEHATLTASDNNSNLGKSVSIDGAGLYAALGGPGTGVGRVRVWKRTGSVWAQIAQPTSPNNVSGEQFGSSVKLSNDGNTLLASARNGRENSKSGAGRVYVYERTNDQFLIKNTFTSALDEEPNGGGGLGGILGPIISLLGPSTNAYFGDNIDISSNGNTILIGEPGDDITLTNSGAVHVFLRNTSGSWFDDYGRSLLKAPVPTASQGFGSSVALTSFGDRAVVATSLDSTNGFSQSGSIHIFN